MKMKKRKSSYLKNNNNTSKSQKCPNSICTFHTRSMRHNSAKDQLLSHFENNVDCARFITQSSCGKKWALLSSYTRHQNHCIDCILLPNPSYDHHNNPDHQTIPLCKPTTPSQRLESISLISRKGRAINPPYHAMPDLSKSKKAIPSNTNKTNEIANIFPHYNSKSVGLCIIISSRF